MDFENIKEKARLNNQSDILRYYNELSDSDKENLANQINNINYSIINKNVLDKSNNRVISPIEVTTIDEIESNKKTFADAGNECLMKGKVAAVLLAGGMGTRLGITGPKGKCDIGVTHPVYIFEMLIRNLMDVVTSVGTYIHLFIMTSDKNNKETMEFFEDKDFFGYKKECIHFFIQEMAPCTDFDGKILMDSKSSIAMSPNGNGGWYKSLKNSETYKIICDNEIEWLNVFGVDNVLQRIADPLFIGATVLSGKMCGSKVIKKANKDEKVGVLCLEDNKPSIVEYYEMTDEMRNTIDENGELIYRYGVILNYLFRVNELDKIYNNELPVHFAEKKIPYIDNTGAYIVPNEPNGYKYEYLILDMVKMMGTCLGYEVVREHEFAPIKNKEGIDSMDTARRLLEKNGILL